jgi:hypothetical protein
VFDTEWSFEFCKRQAICSLTEQLSASEELLCFWKEVASLLRLSVREFLKCVVIDQEGSCLPS